MLNVTNVYKSVSRTVSNSLNELPRHALTGIDLLPIIQIAIPLLLNLPCFKSQNQDPAAFLMSRRRPNGEYRKFVYARARETTVKSLQEAGQPIPETRREIDIITKSLLDEAVNNPVTSKALMESLNVGQTTTSAGDYPPIDE